MSNIKSEVLSAITSWINIIAFVTLTSLGYMVSEDVREIQENTDKRESAKEIKEFWEDMHQLSFNSAALTRELKSKLRSFQGTANEVVKAYAKLYPLKDPSLLETDHEFNSAYIEFLKAFEEVHFQLTNITTEYDYTRLKYHQLAKEHKFSGWNHFYNQSKNVSEWRNDITSDTYKIYNIVTDLLTEMKAPSSTLKETHYISTNMVSKYNIFIIPHIKGLRKFSNLNVEKYAAEL